MIRLILSIICSGIIGIVVRVLYDKSGHYFYSLDFKYDNVAIFLIIIILFYIFYKFTFKKLPSIKQSLITLVADTKDIINAKNKEKEDIK